MTMTMTMTNGDFQKSCYDFFPFVKVIVMTMTLAMTKNDCTVYWTLRSKLAGNWTSTMKVS